MTKNSKLEQPDDEMIELTNGYKLPRRTCHVILWSLRLLQANDIPAFVQLVYICKDTGIRDIELVQRLIDLHLLEADGRPHGAIKNVVVCAVPSQFEGVKNPVKERS